MLWTMLAHLHKATEGNEGERLTLQRRLKCSIDVRRDSACWRFKVEAFRPTLFVA